MITAVPVLLLRWLHPLTSAFMLEAQLAGLARPATTAISTDYQWVSLEQISPHAAIAVIASEDQQFPFHAGFDFNSIREAVRASERGKRLRGASTISQQVAKNLFLWSGHSFVRKGLEAYFTVLIEALLAQGAHPRDVSEHRAVRRRHLRRAGGRATLLAQAGAAAELAGGGAARGRAAEPAALCTPTGPRASCCSGATGSSGRCAAWAAPRTCAPWRASAASQR